MMRNKVGIEIRSLGNTGFGGLFAAFREAFAGYEIELDEGQYLAMLKRRGFDPALSFAAFDGDKIVSFTCNGIGDFYGIPTAYDTGTGTLEGYRGKGLATQVFEYSIPYLKEAGIQQYLLEVLQHNAGAVSVYRKIGFEVAREFYYFRLDSNRVAGGAKAVDFPCTLRPVNVNEHNGMASFWDFRPSWQNSFESINRSPRDFICTGAFVEGKLAGYSVFEPASGDITQIAVDKPYRRKGIGSLLFREMLESNKCATVKIVNTDINCDSITAFLRSKNITPTGKQFEMVKKL